MLIHWKAIFAEGGIPSCVLDRCWAKDKYPRLPEGLRKKIHKVFLIPCDYGTRDYDKTRVTMVKATLYSISHVTSYFKLFVPWVEYTHSARSPRKKRGYKDFDTRMLEASIRIQNRTKPRGEQ